MAHVGAEVTLLALRRDGLRLDRTPSIDLIKKSGRQTQQKRLDNLHHQVRQLDKTSCLTRFVTFRDFLELFLPPEIEDGFVARIEQEIKDGEIGGKAPTLFVHLPVSPEPCKVGDIVPVAEIACEEGI